MDLRSVTQTVQQQLVAAAALGDNSTRRTAELLAGAVEPALRLAVQEALTQCADELTAAIAPDRVELALHGGEAGLRFVAAGEEDDGAPQTMRASTAPSVPARGPSPSGAVALTDGADAEDTARVTFRPPQRLKQRLDAAAAQQRLSLNAYLVRTLSDHLDRPVGRTAPSSHRISGWYI